MLLERPTDDVLYDALIARDPAYDGFAYAAVTTTGVFCRLTCAARKPKRGNVRFFASTAQCLEAGFRPCRRCRPLVPADDPGPAVARLLDALDGEPERRWRESDVAAMGYDISTVRRAFKRRFGISFLEMARMRRVGQGLESLVSGASVIDAQLDAGFESGSGFRAAFGRLFGSAPARLRGWHLGQALAPRSRAPHGVRPAPDDRLKETEMNQADKARAFAALHVGGNPFVLYNIWDAGTARAVAAAGALAVATGSWSMAAAHGYEDGERIPLDLVAAVVARIAAAVDLPVSVDMEGGYGISPEQLARTVEVILGTGAVGINMEDQVVGGDGLYGVAEQAERIAAIRGAVDRARAALFVNARTDLFLKERDRSRHAALLGAATERAVAYAEAGASGFFAPGLADPGLIARLCAASPMPVNIMTGDGVPGRDVLADCGVARISHGPFPYIAAMRWLQEQAAPHFRPAG